MADAVELILRAKNLTAQACAEARADLQKVGAGAKAASADLAGVERSAGGLSAGIQGLNSLLGAFGVALSIGSVVSLGKAFLTTTGHLADMAAQTDISTRQLQRFEYAGSLVGVSLDTITTTAGMLQKRLAGDEDSVARAVADLHLNLESLRATDPGQQFEEIAAAISKLPTQAERARVGSALFGRPSCRCCART